MLPELEKINNSNINREIISFLHDLETVSSGKEAANLLLKTISLRLNANFSSFVQKDGNLIRVISQTGESSYVKETFTKEMSQEIYKWVMKQKDLICLKLGGKEQFVFIPLVDYYKDQIIEHGLLVFHVQDSDFELSKELNKAIKILNKITNLSMTRFLKQEEAEKHIILQEQIQAELKLTAKVQRTLCENENHKKILFSVLEDEESKFNGNLWWLCELDTEITLILITEILCKGSPSALLSGYLIGEMNNLKTKAELSLEPQEVLKYLNRKLTNIFKATGITVNAWYGVFNTGARRVKFANANHPDPFLIGPEQQVSVLSTGPLGKGKSLGISQDSSYTEVTSYVSGGSKLVICTEDLLESASKVGDKYDPSWLPQILETIGSLSLAEMKKSLENLLSETKVSNGTASKHSRLALLLEMPS